MTAIVHNLIATARSLLTQNARIEATHCLQAALKLAPDNLDAHNLIEENLLEGNFTEAFNINARISPDDDIFRFFANHPSSLNPIRDYLSDGWRTMCELRSLLEALERPLNTQGAFLEFACGFGRFSRHLAGALPANSLHVSDVVPGSVDFLREQLGVGGFYSATVPEDLAAPQAYNAIFVLSLFSHLPRSTWSRWLRRLNSMLAPGGVLIFTTHGVRSAQLANVNLPEDGFAFFSASESNALPGEEYGCTYTSPDFVRRTISESLGVVGIREFTAHFWSNQDAFAVFREI